LSIRAEFGLLAQAASYLGHGLGARTLGRAPLFLTVFVTSRCPLSCGHCLCAAWRGDREDRELDLDAWRRLAARLPAIPKLLVTGGEPLLRRDLPELVEAFVRGPCAARQVTIPTSGIDPDATLRLVERLLPGNPGLVLEIQLSLDGPKETHESVRGAPVFDALMETWRHLHALEARHPNLRPRFNFTFSARTEDGFGETLDFVTRELGCPRMDMVLVRGDAARPEHGRPVDLGAYLDAARRLRAQEIRVAGASILRRLLAERAFQERRLIAEVATGASFPSPCTAGGLFAVIREDGEILPCEMRDDTFGNLVEADFDFVRLWRSPEAEGFRKEMAHGRCACTFETAVRTTLSFVPSSYGRMLGGAITEGR
jgi:MoaA/NifB/PqqE/SkfB family radical SAM enzyme